MPTPQPMRRRLPPLPPREITQDRVRSHINIRLNGVIVARVGPCELQWRCHNLGACHASLYPTESAALAAAHRIARMLSAGQRYGRKLTA